MPIRLGQEFTAYAGSIDRNVRRLSEAAEYLREEARLVPTRRELDSFFDAVDTLRADVDRLVTTVTQFADGGAR